MNNSVKLSVFSLLMAPISFCVAEQVHFSKVENDESYQFNYRWLDIKSMPQSLSFTLEKQTLFNKFRDFKAFKPQMAQRHISKSVVKHLQKEPITDVRVSYNNHTNNIELSSTKADKFASTKMKISELEQKYTDKYLDANNYHHFKNHHNVTAIKPNHVKFANLSVDDLKPIKPLILDKVSIKNIRKATDYILGFIQSIPYSRLESRANSAGAGFNPPLKLLWENQGDCDSKVTLTASILRSLMPRINIALVFIDNHALIGIEVVPKGDEVTITLDGVTYLLGEPTGPAKLPLGTLDDASKLAVLQGQYIAEKLP